ncbi:toxin-antitoxin system HicB family antitoxin [Phytoactinopolyspora halotolerans]|uniref:Toxin-antitoxin system HicB family antitoxin n=1 Tax=Phytoactinopolyspora halotolerans TaxID=1981512 RepID=A0A6L9S199_9ACTN|nr:toxin-antitoxin system HicB family antitoxin [Phytoactinopolyspora halotolerans]NED98758.1 toxin-antitoxin system HicB family antitoxin [Phytoactinopolyspora halotolerans]
MELTPYVSALRNALAAAGHAASDEVREAADRLSYAIEPSLRLTLIEAMGDAAAEVTTQLEGVSVDVRMRGGNPEFVASDERPPASFEPPEPPEPPTPPPPPEPEENLSRVTLRLPESLKSRIEEAAAAEGMSVNAWLVRAVGQLLDGPHTDIHVGSSGVQVGPRGVQVNLGRRISGWAR